MLACWHLWRRQWRFLALAGSLLLAGSLASASGGYWETLVGYPLTAAAIVAIGVVQSRVCDSFGARLFYFIGFLVLLVAAIRVAGQDPQALGESQWFILGLAVALIAFVVIPEFLLPGRSACLPGASLTNVSRAGFAVTLIAPFAGLALGLVLGVPRWAVWVVASIVVTVVLVLFSSITARWTAEGREHRRRRVERLRAGESRWQMDVAQPFHQIVDGLGGPSRALITLAVVGAALGLSRAW